MTAGPISNFPFIVFYKFSQIVYAEVCLPFILTFLRTETCCPKWESSKNTWLSKKRANFENIFLKNYTILQKSNR